MIQDKAIDLNGNPITQAQMMEQAKKILMVNADEVTREIIDVEIREFIDKPVLLNGGAPLLDGQGKPLTYREFVGKRTAHILNTAPVDIYARAVDIYNSNTGEAANKEQIVAMGDVVFQVWNITEPFMTRERLLNGGIDGDEVIRLFMLFFDKMNRLQSA